MASKTHSTGCHRQVPVLTFQRLDPSQFIGARHSLTLFCQDGTILVQTTYVTDLFLRLLICVAS